MDARGQHHRRAQRTAAGTLLLAALLVGCGEDSNSPPGDEPSEPEVTQSAPDDEHEGGDHTAGGDAPEDEQAPGAEEAVVVISDFAYSLPDTVAPGAELVVRNEDSVGHTVTSDDGVFDVVVPPGEEVAFTVPDEPGEYPFHCTPHPTMTGTLVVG